MEHPLLEDLSSLTLDQIQSKISDINKKLAFAYRSGNGSVVAQLQLIMGSYQEAYSKKMDSLMPKGDGDKYADKIDIGR